MNNETTQTTTAVQLTKAQAILLRRAIQDSMDDIDEGRSAELNGEMDALIVLRRAVGVAA